MWMMPLHLHVNQKSNYDDDDVHAWIVPLWADQLLPQLLMEQFDTLSIQCRHIEHMHEGVWFRKNNF